MIAPIAIVEHTASEVVADLPETTSVPCSGLGQDRGVASSEELERFISFSEISSHGGTTPVSPELAATAASAIRTVPTTGPANFSPIADEDETMPNTAPTPQPSIFLALFLRPSQMRP